MTAFERVKYRLFSAFPKRYASAGGLKIGKNVRIMDGVSFGSEPYLIEIGNHVTISSDVLFITHDGGTWVFREQERFQDVIKYGKITVGNNCFLGARSIIMPNVAIGNNCVIAAGSIVTRDVPDNTVYGGNPAKMICTLDEYAEKCLLRNPDYNKTNYIKNKKDELLRILNDK